MAQSSEPEAVPTPPEVQTPAGKPDGLNVNKLGVFLDGWADLIEGRGEKAVEVKQLAYQYLTERHMPDIQVGQVSGSVGIGSQKRPYNITTTSPSATTAIYVGEHGKDLYVSWRTFIRPQLSPVVFAIAIISGLIGLLMGLRLSSIRYESLIFQFSGSDVIGSIFTMSLMMTIFIFALLTFFLAVLGIALKGDFRAYFFIEPNIFDAEDITAMGLSAHKSLLRALDTTGIEVKELRLKQNFKGGRASEDI